MEEGKELKEKEKQEQQATHMPFRDWCANCMMSRGRIHHHVSKKRTEIWSRRPTKAMDNYFFKPNSTASSQTKPDESVTCIAVKEDRLLKGIEEPWASERVARFINTLGYKEIPSEPAIIAFQGSCG